MVGWVIFYFTDLGQLGIYLLAMIGVGTTGLTDTILNITVMNNIFWIILALVLCTPVVKKTREFLLEKGFTTVLYGLQIPANIALLFICTAMLAGQSYNPFLYFRF